MTARKFVLGLFLSTVLLSSGCDALFGDQQQHGLAAVNDGGACIRDKPALTALLTQPKTCAANETCPAGSYCDLSRGSCQVQCMGDSDCPIAGDLCSCLGQCTAGGGIVTSPSGDSVCERDRDLLLGTATLPGVKTQSCGQDDKCAPGSRCDVTTRRCTWDCVATGDPTYGCPANTVCNCYGACVAPSGGLEARPASALPRLEVVPDRVSVVVQTGTWAARRMDVALVASTLDIATAARSAVVFVRAGTELQVTCDQNLGANGAYADTCQLSNWTFALTDSASPVDAGVQDERLATAFVWVKPKSMVTQTDWVVTLSSAGVVKSPLVVSIASMTDPTIPPADQPQDGEYVGYLELLGATGMAAGLGQAGQVGMQLPVAAWVTADAVDFMDDLRVVTPTGKLRVRATTPEDFAFLSPTAAPEGAMADTTGAVGATVLPGTRSAVAAQGKLSGTFTLRTSLGRGFGYAHWQYRLERIRASTACSATVACKEPYACDVAKGICTGGPAWVIGTPAAMRYAWFAYQLTLFREFLWLTAVSRFCWFGTSCNVLSLSQLPQYMNVDIYDGNQGIGSKELSTHLQFLGADTLAFDHDAILGGSSAGGSQGLELCQRDFQKYLTWMDAQTGITDLVRTSTGTTYASSHTGICSDLYSGPTGGNVEGDYVPCVDYTPKSTPAPTGKLADLPTDKSASCSALYENWKQVQAPLPAPSYIPTSLSSFLSTSCKPLSEVLVLQKSGVSTEDVHSLYLCPFREALFGPLNPATLAERYLCYEVPAQSKQVLESSTLGATSMLYSGDLACANSKVPHGIDLVAARDRAASSSGGRTALLAECLAELSAVGPQSQPSGEDLVADLATFFPAGRCVSLGHYHAALGTLEDAIASRATDLPLDRRIGQMYLRLLQQWVELHTFLGREEFEQLDVAQSATGDLKDLNDADRAALQSLPDVTEVLDQEERGWNLILAKASNLFAIPASQVRSPDYRPNSATNYAHHEQRVGLPVTLLEGATGHLSLVEAYLRHAADRAYESCLGGGSSAVRDEAIERFARTQRYVATIEALAVSLYDNATINRCGTGLPACKTGTTCNASIGICETTGVWSRETTTWDKRWSDARGEYLAQRTRALNAAKGLYACQNSLGISEDELPIYFADPTGTSGRFFASSDYLVSSWATPAVEFARGSLEAARTAWSAKRQASIQDIQTRHDAERRREDIGARYGREIVDACGIGNLESKDVLAAFGSGPGQLTPDNCYVDTSKPECSDLVASAHAKITDSVVQQRLCAWNSLIALGVMEVPATIKTLAAGWRTATVATTRTSFSANGVAAPIDYLYELPTDEVDLHALRGMTQLCAAVSFGGTFYPLPELPTPPTSCYRGQIGEAWLGVISAQQGMGIAITEWQAQQTRYEQQIQNCQELAVLLKRENDFTDKFLRTYKGLAAELGLAQDIQATMAFAIEVGKAYAGAPDPQGLASTGQEVAPLIHDAICKAHKKAGGWARKYLGKIPVVGKYVGLAVGGLVEGTGLLSCYLSKSPRKIAAAIELLRVSYEAAMTKFANEEKMLSCLNEADKYLIDIHSLAQRIDQANTNVAQSAVRFDNLKTLVGQRLLEGNAALAREVGRNVPTIAHHYWLDERIDRYRKDFAWARRLTYIAMRAVEYEYQQSLPLRKEILAATHPDQLLDAIRLMQQDQITRTINNRRPEDASLVVSLRDDVLGKASQQGFGRRVRNWSAKVRFQHQLWSPEYAVFDEQGAYLGQGIPFTLDETGALKLRCAERLWRVTATLQGDTLDVSAPSAPIFLRKQNTFRSQWCAGHGDDSQYQVGEVQPSSDLFHPEDRAISEAARVPYLTAMLQPWFNVRRSDFYRDAYQEGASEELAGRGLYGNYVLLFPWHGLLEEGFPLEQMEDVLLRFDYLSVDNL